MEAVLSMAMKLSGGNPFGLEELFPPEKVHSPETALIVASSEVPSPPRDPPIVTAPD
jgi:hypothetical protein